MNKLSTVAWRCFFFFNDPATTEIYTLSLHDALPISVALHPAKELAPPGQEPRTGGARDGGPAEEERGLHGFEAQAVPLEDRKSTRLNSSHLVISYAVFCLKKTQRRNRQEIPLAVSPP